MKKRLLASLLAAAMTLTMAPAAFAAGGETAELSKNPTSSITTTQEDSNTLQYKIDHDTTGKVIVLDQNYKESITLKQGKYSIDLNGYTITNEDGKDTITISKGASLAIEGNGTVDNVSHGKAAIWNNGTCTLNGGMFTGGIYTINNDCAANLTINGGTFTNETQAVFQNHGKATVTGGTFVGTLNIYGLNSDVSIVNISGGNFKGGIQKNIGKISISGGNFNFDPTDFCAEGKIGVPSDNKDYPYTVADVVNNVKVAPPAAPTAKANTGKYDENSDEATKMQKVAESIAAKDSKTKITGLDDVAKTEATKITKDDVDKATKKLKDAGVNPSENEKVSLYVQPYLDITVSDIDLNADNKNAPIALTLDIVPKVKKIASTATNAADIKTDEGNGKNAVQVDETPVEVNTPVKITIPMPDDFPAQDGANNIVVKHEKKGQFICYHHATYKATDNTVTFTNDKGFSTFTIKFDNRSAKIQFTDKDGKNIGKKTKYDAIKVNETLPTTEAPSGYKFTGWSFKSDDETISGTYTVMTEELLTKLDNRYKVYTATPVFASTSSSSGGSSSGGSSSKSTYKVTTSSVANGGVNVSPSSPAKGDKVKITLSPNKGYKLDKLTVTDASGKTVSTTKTSDTVYTFTMPASQVTVGVTYVKADETTEQPSTKTFSDVSSSDWFADAVKYVSDKGLMSGTGSDKFAPSATTTRAMLMTVLARYAGQDTTGSNPWYQKGMEWAKANGVSDGTAPNANITREQLVTMLYRYAKSTGKDVSVGKDTNILSYADVTTVSEYAVPAMQWACGAGIVNGANGKLNPQNNATRAEVAAILMRYCENIR